MPYRLGASIELFLKVAREFGIRWCALTDNDQQGQMDQQHVRNYTLPADFPAVLHAMPESDIETHLCSAGFGAVYEAYLTPQLRMGITVAPGHTDYWSQVLKAIKNVRGYKPSAALEVTRQIHAGTSPVPPLLETAIRKSVELAGGV